MLLPSQSVEFTELALPVYRQKQVEVTVARLDLIHPVVSGNKLFKLHYFLQEAQASSHKCMLTFGGAYSNHLVATAYAAANLGLRSIGIVRGERPQNLSHTLENCLNYGMQLEFVARADYNYLQDADREATLLDRYGECIIIPEGGYSRRGAEGASLIMQYEQMSTATHICTAVGTATTLAGVLLGAADSQEIIAVPAIKGMYDLEDRIKYLSGNDHSKKNLVVFNEYHFGGYAKHSPELLRFMNKTYEESLLPTDFIYTAKMMFAINDKIGKGYFPPGSKIMCIHTGGLQGNLSLPAGTLVF